MIARVGISAWLGLALAALFFYPLVVFLDTETYYLQWQQRDVTETFLAIAILGLIASAAIFALWPRTSRAASAGLLAVAVFPVTSFVAGALRQLPFDDALREAWENPALSLSVPGIVAALFLIALWRWPEAFNRRLRSALIVISPIALVVILGLARSSGGVPAVTSVDRPSPVAAAARMCAPVLTFLFDELSFTYLYEDGTVRPEFPEIGRFASTATNHLAVSAAGGETLLAVPAMLVARPLRGVRVAPDGLYELTEEGSLQPFNAREPDGLFATARGLGYRTEMAGYYLPYCYLLGDLVDACRSMSFYNVATTNDRFSILDPIRTTMVLWPRQFPFGVFKNPFFTRFQRDLVARTIEFVQRPVGTAPPVFRLLHFSIPHLPFVFGPDGFDPPLDPLRTSPDTGYVAQLAYVDRLVGEAVARLRESGAYDGATVVLMSDHGWRFGGNEQDPQHVPFIVKRPGQRTREDVTTPERGELLLKQVLQQSCPAV